MQKKTSAITPGKDPSINQRYQPTISTVDINQRYHPTLPTDAINNTINQRYQTTLSTIGINQWWFRLATNSKNSRATTDDRRAGDIPRATRRLQAGGNPALYTTHSNGATRQGQRIDMTEGYAYSHASSRAPPPPPPLRPLKPAFTYPGKGSSSTSLTHGMATASRPPDMSFPDLCPFLHPSTGDDLGRSQNVVSSSRAHSVSCLATAAS